MNKVFVLLLAIFTIYNNQIIFSQPLTWESRGIGGGGAIQNPSISPFNSKRVILSCDMSQMFETKDFGDNWNTFNFNNLPGGIRAKVCFTNDSTILYAIGISSSGSYTPKKSTDGGKTWTTFSNNPCTNFGAFQLYANPSDYNQLVISDKSHIFFSSNGGTSFSTIETDNSASGLHLAGAFFDGANIYIASDKKVFISSNNGNSFASTILNSANNINSTESVVSFTGAKQGNKTKFFCTTISTTNFSCKTYGFDVQYFVGLYEMSYANNTSLWNNITSNLNGTSNTETEKAYFVRTLPNDTNTVYVGGSILSNASTYGTIYKSTNSGANWTNLFLNNTKASTNSNITTGWVGNSSNNTYSHGWVSINTTEGLCIDPNNINNIIMTDKSNIHYSKDGGLNWNQMYIKSTDQNSPNQLFNSTKEYATTGLKTAVTYWLTWVDSLNLIATCADLTAIKSSDGGKKWGYNYNSTNIYAGGNLKINDISMMVKQPKTGVLYASTGDVVGSNGVWDDSRLSQSHGRICFSADNGNTWQILKDFNRPVTNIHFDSKHPDTLYACVQDINAGNIGGIYRCNAVSLGSNSVWTKLNSPTRASNRPNSIYALKDGSLLCSYYPYDSTSNYNYAKRSGVFISTDNGNSWIDRTSSTMLKKTYTLEEDINDPLQKTWYASVGNDGTQNNSGLYKTVDRGLNWTNLTPGISTLSCSFNPSVTDEMYICTELNGLYFVNNTASFSPIQLANYDFRNPQKVFFNPYIKNEIWITSFGNGLKVGQTSTNSAGIKEIKLSSNLVVYPNPTNDLIHVNLNDKEIKQLEIYSLSGTLLKESVENKISIAEFSNGIYLLKISSLDNKIDFLKIVKE